MAATVTIRHCGKQVEHRILAVAADSQFDSHGVEHWRMITHLTDGTVYGVTTHWTGRVTIPPPSALTLQPCNHPRTDRI
jgi:hypothetical protein